MIINRAFGNINIARDEEKKAEDIADSLAGARSYNLHVGQARSAGGRKLQNPQEPSRGYFGKW